MVSAVEKPNPGRGPTARIANRAARAALMASLLAQMRQPHELTRLSLLLLVMASLRLRGYTISAPDQPVRPDAALSQTVPRKGINIKRPRARFL